MDGIVALLLSKKFTKDTVIGMGAIKGAACQVQSINKVGKTTTITLKWKDDNGGVHTQAFDVEDGADGVSVTNATINANGHLILTLSNGNSIDCGQVLPQYDTMPTPSVTNEGQILQYIGTTGGGFTNGYFYICESDGVGGYHWVEKLVQDSYTKTQIGDLTDLPDNTKNVVQNINGLKLSIDQLSASKLSISDIDNVLSESSENPVQNKVIKLTIDQLRGSILTALDKKEDKFRVTLMPLITADDVGKLVQYIGDTTMSLTKGYFYEAVEVSTGVYDWVQKNVQPSGGGTGGDGVVDGYYNSTDHLFYEEAGYINPIAGDSNTLYVSLDTNLLYRYNSDSSIFIRVDNENISSIVNGYYNETDHKFYEEPTYITEITGEIGKIYISDDTNIQYRWDGTQFVTISSSIDVDNALSTISENPVQNKIITVAINGLEASKLSLSDVDNALSGTSLYPVQNKVVKLTVDQLQGSILTKIQKKLAANADDFAVFTNDGDITDSGISKDIVPSNASVSNKLLVESDLTQGDGIDITGTTISLDVDYLTASRVGYISNTEKGSNNGVAELDSTGKVPSSQLPSSVDSIVEGYLYNGSFYEDSAHTQLITPESNKIYVNLDMNTTYRWGGTVYVQISESLALGTTHTTAYYGDLGKIAYDHSQIKDGSNPHNTTADNVNLKVPISALSGTKLDVESTLYGINTELGKKADKVASATNGHLAGLDSNGNLTDSGVVADDVIQKVATATGLLKDDGTVDTTDYQPINLSVPIDTLGGTMLTVETTLGEFNTEIKSIDTDLNDKADLTDLAPEFDDTTAYTIGQYVIYNGDVYKFITDHSAGAWVGTDATKVDIGGELLNKVSYDFNAKTGVHNLYDFTKNVKEGANVAISFTSTGVRVYTTANAAYAVSNVPISATGMKVGNDYTLEADVTYVSGQGRMTVRDGVTIQKTTDVITSSGHYSITFTLLSNYTSISLFSTLSTIEAGDITFNNIVIKNVEDSYVGYAEYAESNVELTQNKLSYADNSILGAKNLLPNDAVTTTTAQGVTYVVNNDKTVSVASGQTMSTYTNLSLGSVILPEGDYILNGCPSGGGANTYRLRLVNGSTLLGIDSGDGYSFHADGNTNYTVTIGLSASGVSYTVPTDLLFKPMIRLVSDPDDTYVPYAMTNKELTKCVTWKDV